MESSIFDLLMTILDLIDIWTEPISDNAGDKSRKKLIHSAQWTARY